MTDFDELQKQVVEFRDARDWKQFHNPKDMAISMLLEASEFLEHFQWKNELEIREHLKKHKDDVSDELVDVVYWVMLIAHDLDIDIANAFERKMQKNDKKYAVKKSKGNHKKYTELS